MGSAIARLIAAAARWGEDLLAQIYPRVCTVCHTSLVEGEQGLCLHCLAGLPRTFIHTSRFNTLHERLSSPGVLVDRAGAWFFYLRKNEYSAMIHDAKYRGMFSLARLWGEIYAREIVADGFFDGMDAILPVPMHISKQRRRGYNQAHEIALGISKVTGIPVAGNLVARRPHDTQTRKNAWQRWINARHTYEVDRPAELAGKHVLVVDDVVTTGATMLACLTALHSLPSAPKTSVLALAATHLR